MTEEIERRMSRDVAGVSILRRDDSMAARIAASTPGRGCSVLACRVWKLCWSR